MDKEELITYENILYVIKKFQKQGFESLKLEDLAIAISVSDFRIHFLKQTGIDWVQKYELKALEKLRKCNFDMQWMQSEIQEEYTPLFNYIKKGDLQKTKEFIQNHSQIELIRKAQDSHNRSALHLASKLGHTVIVEYLLLQGFSVFSRDKQLQTPLHLAAYYSQEYICEQLIKKGASLEATDIKGRAPFHYACCSSSSRIVIMFIGLCPEIVESVDNDLLNGLHYAVLNSSQKQVEIIRALLDYGVKVNQRDKDGKTPLYLASETGKSRDDIQWMDNAIKGQNLIKEVPFKENINTQQNTVKKNNTQKKLKEQQGTIQGWVREKFFKLMKNVQEEGIKVNQHLKKPFIYTGSWMESIQNVEDLYNLLSNNMNSTEATLCAFNILCPYEGELPKEEQNKEVIDNFYGDAWGSCLKVTLETKKKQDEELQEKVFQVDDLKEKLEVYEKILKEKTEEMKKLRQQNAEMNIKLEEYKGVQINQANLQLLQEIQKENEKLKLEIRVKSRELMEKDMEIQLQMLEGNKDLGEKKDEKNKREVQLEEELKILKIENQMQRFKAGQIFLNALDNNNKGNNNNRGNNNNNQQKVDEELNIFDDDAIINLYKALKENPQPKFIQRLKDVDKDKDGFISQNEFVKFCNQLNLSNQDIVSLQRIVGFFDQKKSLGISEFKEILESRPKQRQIQEEILFKKILQCFQKDNISLEEVFIQLDQDNSGDISPQELKEGLQNMNADLNQADYNCLFNIFDRDRNGKISLQEMKETMQIYLEKMEKKVEEEVMEYEEIWIKENQQFLIEEKDLNQNQFLSLKNQIKIQIPGFRGRINSKNVFFKIALKGSVENCIFKQGIIQNNLTQIALRFTFEENTKICDIGQFINIQVFSNEKISENSFLGEVFVAWKCCLNTKNEWKINQEFSFVNNEYKRNKNIETNGRNINRIRNMLNICIN
ncbi:hypothetical protein IMG5_196230 [Ichthyophthirius multifiliis]|uniref:EF-hand domain-containing protein n=1 Tax=Ichthyophthirius multifiliis TaxID=5932 RepID=G0R538_ICHMU|nr:hypothetical protein IMG5_196230 [Ichthyophthirius multifiliis]EGR27440.1 hypothetical protein IMG5_196230 [Ichthyophthirius multifiliis]|eukprot:XP_004024350.1 hypothetical protein IMG5_196230 [Ichthyophthirius multifiliis]